MAARMAVFTEQAEEAIRELQRLKVKSRTTTDEDE